MLRWRRKIKTQRNVHVNAEGLDLRLPGIRWPLTTESVFLSGWLRLPSRGNVLLLLVSSRSSGLSAKSYSDMHAGGCGHTVLGGGGEAWSEWCAACGGLGTTAALPPPLE